jgi:hypothetical protein
VQSFYQDQDGTMWVVTSAGIDNFPSWSDPTRRHRLRPILQNTAA